MKKAYLAPILALALGASPGCIFVADDGEASLTVVNQSSFAFYEIYVAPSGTGRYGGNLLGSSPLFPHESLEIILDCGVYDVLVVDQDGYSCTLYSEDLCFENKLWVIDDVDLALCSF